VRLVLENKQNVELIILKEQNILFDESDNRSEWGREKPTMSTHLFEGEGVVAKKPTTSTIRVRIG
jgi:hypothetical protein